MPSLNVLNNLKNTVLYAYASELIFFLVGRHASIPYISMGKQFAETILSVSAISFADAIFAKTALIHLKNLTFLE